MRTCIGCRRRAERSELRRFVVLADNGGARLAYDRERTLPGRGLYLCGDAECLERAVARRAVHRAARAEGVQITIGPEIVVSLAGGS